MIGGHDAKGFAIAPPITGCDARVDAHIVDRQVLDEAGPVAGHDADAAIAFQDDDIVDQDIAHDRMHVADGDRLGT